MNIQKIFAGPRVKKIRNSIGLSQSAMANELGHISKLSKFN
jgi:transcriptional regulator with XRE-family HTH domain